MKTTAKKQPNRKQRPGKNEHGVITEAPAWLESLRARGFSAATIACRRDSLRAFQLFLAESGIDRVEDVTVRVLEDWRRRMLECGLRQSTAELRLGSIRLLLDFLEARGLIFENPARSMCLHLKDMPLPRVPTVAQVLAILEKPDVSTPAGIRDRALLEIMYATGMRLEEVTGLDAADLDLDGQTVRVRGKGGRERLLPLGRACLQWLRTYLESARPVLLRGDTGIQRVWIAEPSGRPLGKSGVAARVGRHMRAAGLPRRFTPHALRRAAATHMLANGASPFAIKELLGHASMKHLSRYLRVTETDLKRMHRASTVGK